MISTKQSADSDYVVDELPEFRRNVLEVLRQSMEGKMMTISSARYTIDYPASFMLVASMNPCPCGYYNHPSRECECPPGTVQKYLVEKCHGKAGSVSQSI